MPGTAAGTVWRKQRIVASATSSGRALPPEYFLPGITMFGFSSMPSSSHALVVQLVEDRVQRLRW